SETAGGGVEGGEKFIDCEDISSGHQVQQGGLPSVRITDNSCDWPLMPLAALSLHTPNFAHAFELAFESRDPFLHPPAIHFQLCFARPARPDPTSLTRKMVPHSR